MDKVMQFTNVDILITFFSFVAAFFALVMLRARKAITTALSFLAILLSTAYIYAMINEHFIAAIQLVVYAGAIMVLFIFSIMLLNFKNEEHIRLTGKYPTYIFAILSIVGIFGGLVWAIAYHFREGDHTYGEYTLEKISAMGGNTQLLATKLFTTHAMVFELVSILLLIALVAAVVLAKRKLD